MSFAFQQTFIFNATRFRTRIRRILETDCLSASAPLPSHADRMWHKETRRQFRKVQYGTKAGALQQNPVDDVEQLPANAPTFHVITPAEEKIYLMACPPLLQDVATLMLEGGFRCGEVYQLQRKDFHPEKNFVQIAKGKTKSARRRVYLTSRAKAVLMRRAEKFKGAYLFPHFDVDGNPPTRPLTYVHAEVIEKLNFNFRIYDCRHSFASRAVESGVDLVTLAAILGHTNLRMLTRYCHPSETAKENAILKMEKLAKAV